MKRVITGHGNGKSVILDDAEISPTPLMEGKFGSEMAVLGGAEGIPAIPVEDINTIVQVPPGAPKPGRVNVAFAWLSPDEEVFRKAKENNWDIEGLWKQYLGDDYGMHTTDTIDFDVILSGEIWLELDDGVEVHLKAGDCVVQNGTRHAWRNRGTEPCLMAVFAIGANRT